MQFLMVFSSSGRVLLLLTHLLFYISFAAMRTRFGPVAVLPGISLAVLLIWISCVDIERFEIPDTASALLALSGAIFSGRAGVSVFFDHLIAGLLWAGIFWLVSVLYKKLRDTDGLGFGDVKLMLGIGLWAGLSGTTAVVFTATLCGAIVIALREGINRTPNATLAQTGVAFGPFLCLSTWVIWLFRGAI